MRSRKPSGWMTWLLLAIVLIGGWMAWPQQAPQQQQAPVSTSDTAPSPPLEAPRPLPPIADAPGPQDAAEDLRLPGFLPPEAQDTLALIQRGGPFPHRQDGSVFGNREGRLPRKPRGWYREFTVETPGLQHRGARRIVTGGNPPREWYYSDDHYDSFRRFDPAGSTP